METVGAVSMQSARATRIAPANFSDRSSRAKAENCAIPDFAFP